MTELMRNEPPPRPPGKLVTWLRENWKELGVKGLLLTFALWAGRTLILQGQKNEDLQQQIDTLEKWAGCQEKGVITAKRYRFNWPTLECVELPGEAWKSPASAETSSEEMEEMVSRVLRKIAKEEDP